MDAKRSSSLVAPSGTARMHLLTDVVALSEKLASLSCSSLLFSFTRRRYWMNGITLN